MTPFNANEQKYDYLWLITPLTHLQFEVMACHDVHVLLAHKPWNDTYKVFEVVIGGWQNERSVIRDADVSVPASHFPFTCSTCGQICAFGICVSRSNINNKPFIFAA